MANVTLEEVIEEVKALPPADQQQLGELLNNFGHLLFVAGALLILEKMHALPPAELQQARKLLLSPPLLLSPSERESSVRRTRGKYAHIGTSSDQFAQLKQEEIKLEDRRR